MNGDWKEIEKHIKQVTGKNICFTKSSSVSGGCINDAFKITDTNNNHWFLKTNKPYELDMFKAESLGLDALRETQSLRIPKTICYGSNSTFSYHVLEHIELNPQINQASTGEALAKMHLQQTNNATGHATKPYGWKRDNTIGLTPQSNQPHRNWVSFFKEERLLFQLNLANNKGYSKAHYENGLKLIENMDAFFSTYTPHASLLHGDLWAGNCASDNKGNPVVFDPAVYIGDRETDIAMTELFGGFNQGFYDAYHAHYPLDSDYKTRKQLYNLYHILNHFNLFGGGYATQAAKMTQRLLAET